MGLGGVRCRLRESLTGHFRPGRAALSARVRWLHCCLHLLLTLWLIPITELQEGEAPCAQGLDPFTGVQQTQAICSETPIHV